MSNLIRLLQINHDDLYCKGTNISEIRNTSLKILWDSRKSVYRTPSRNTFFDIIDRFTACYKREKEEKPFDFSSVVSGCGGITDYRTFMNDFRKCAEFVRWLKEKAEG